VRSPGKADDKIIEIKDASIPLTPKVFASITPSYSTERINTSYHGDMLVSAPANSFGAFDMAAYNQLDFTFGYNLTKNINANFNINNVLNTTWSYWMVSLKFTTKACLKILPKHNDASKCYLGARTTQPRAFYLTISYNFN
jgi:outer membrane receptor protein involved in Fe transport